MISIRGTVSKGWLARRMSVRFDRRYYFEPIARRAIDTRCNQYVREHFSNLPVFYGESNLGRIEYWNSDCMLVGGIQPNLILGMLLGAEFVPAEFGDADIRTPCLDTARVAQWPPVQRLLDHPLIAEFDQQLDVIHTNHSDCVPIPPFFWDTSGRAAVHGPLTTAYKLCGESFLIDLVNEPDRARRVVDWTTEAIAVVLDHFARQATFTPHGIHIGECICCMLDASTVRRFAVPAASRLGSQFGPVRFHSCGGNNHIVDELPAIDHLQSVDVGGDTSVGRLRNALGPQLTIGIAPLVSHLQDPDSEALDRWLQRITEENRAGPLELGYHWEHGYRDAALQRMHDCVDRWPPSR